MTTVTTVEFDHYIKILAPKITVEDSCCPKCQKYSNETDILFMEESKFKEEPDPHMAWREIIKCSSCETVYVILNGT